MLRTQVFLKVKIKINVSGSFMFFSCPPRSLGCGYLSLPSRGTTVCVACGSRSPIWEASPAFRMCKTKLLLDLSGLEVASSLLKARDSGHKHAHTCVAGSL